MKLNTLNLSIFALALFTVSSSVFAQNKIGDNLSYFHADRETAQTKVIVADFAGKSDVELAKYLSEMERGAAPQNVIDGFKVAVENNRKIAPKYVAMMEQQAKLRGVPVHQLFAEASVEDWKVIQGVKEALGAGEEIESLNGCTTAAFNTGIVGQNNDLGLDHLTPDTTVIKTDTAIFLPTDGAHFQGMGKHVGIVLNVVVDTGGEEGLGKDNLVSTDAVFAAATGSKSIDDFKKKITGFTTIVPINFTVADDQGNHAAIRVSNDGLEIVNQRARGSASGNHSEQLKQELLKKMSLFEANDAFFDTFARESHALAFLDYCPELNVEAMQYLFSERPINLAKYNDKSFVTVETMIFDTVNGCAYVTGDNPRFTKYTKISLNGDSKSDEEAIAELVKMQDAALAASDRETLDRLIDDEGHFTTEDGKILNKQDYISDCLSHHSDSMQFETSDSVDVTVRVLGDTAIQTGTWIGTGKNDGKPFRIEKRSITIWIRRGSTWVLTEEQTFRVPSSD
ncbi:hypothetical protein CA13_60260 [Planctomycetes bacterium CA13]|uniref:DUF4440 domain-containing protein n=1 Tax=Novipirellula herctigrandis TaxID=2527986 RepID=A0A5C5ZBN9_9BACT|nr:hypothetical protein CA13_60260 [Planctomycetes bacterium CA13]